MEHAAHYLAPVTALPSISDTFADYQLLDGEDRYRLLIELGRMLEPMPDALKTDATKVRGCSSSTWVYPTRLEDGRLHFLADSNAAITKGIVALILSAVQDRQPDEIVTLDLFKELEPFDLKRELSSNRTQGVPNMIALIQETARRLAA
ncbi:MAG TPA: SufE family protein [Sphingomicrobium sp.]|nr:SufE family protein [Sphingomicrobium sp.]